MVYLHAVGGVVSTGANVDPVARLRSPEKPQFRGRGIHDDDNGLSLAVDADRSDKRARPI